MLARELKIVEEIEEREPEAGLKSISQTSAESSDAQRDAEQVKFEIYGQELMEKEVRRSGNSGRVYLPPHWIGHKVKIVKIN